MQTLIIATMLGTLNCECTNTQETCGRGALVLLLVHTQCRCFIQVQRLAEKKGGKFRESGCSAALQRLDTFRSNEDCNCAYRFETLI